MKFLKVNDFYYGTKNYSTVINIKISVNPYLKMSHFYVKSANFNITLPQDLKIIDHHTTIYNLELMFALKKAGNYTIHFKDSEVNGPEMKSRNFEVKGES